MATDHEQPTPADSQLTNRNDAVYKPPGMWDFDNNIWYGLLLFRDAFGIAVSCWWGGNGNVCGLNSKSTIKCYILHRSSVKTMHPILYIIKTPLGLGHLDYLQWPPLVGWRWDWLVGRPRPIVPSTRARTLLMFNPITTCATRVTALTTLKVLPCQIWTSDGPVW